MKNMALGAGFLIVQGGLIPRGDLNFSEAIWGLTTFISCSSHFVDFMSSSPQYNVNLKKNFACSGLFPKYIEDLKIFSLNCF